MSAAKTLTIVTVALSVCITMTNAQEAPVERITKVVPIAHADAERLAKVLEYVEPGLRAAATDATIAIHNTIRLISSSAQTKPILKNYSIFVSGAI